MPPGGHVFDGAILFLVGHSVIISTKLFLIQKTGFTEDF